MFGHFAKRGLRVIEPKKVPKGIVKEMRVAPKPNLSIMK